MLHSNVKFTVIGEYKIYLRIRSAKEFSNWKNFKKWLNKDGDNLWQVVCTFNFTLDLTRATTIESMLFNFLI